VSAARGESPRARSGRDARRAYALIIAGGRGTRFWPESRAWRPKPLFSIDGRSTLLAETIARLQPLLERQRIFVLVSADQRAIFRKALKGLIPAANLILEPQGRGTAVAIAYGCAVIAHRAGPNVVAVMSADHYITPAADFRRTLGDAVALAGSRRAIVLIGVPPTRAEPGYGYQQIGAPVGRGFKVVRFIEKPPLARARRMVASGKYLWNAGMFVMDTAALAAELDEHAPALARAMAELGGASAAKVANVYRRLDFDAFDRVVAEKSRNVLTVKARFQWHDVGSWEGLWEAVRGRKPNVLKGEVIALDSEGVLARGDRRLMVLLGVKDLVAVDTGDAILIASRQSSQDLRRVVDELARRGLRRYL
jgi:mannose-1-phosphate guanylyltransferase/mannose-6-phosphate isomerase